MVAAAAAMIHRPQAILVDLVAVRIMEYMDKVQRLKRVLLQ
jgi:hypothetical protein